jgi:hypothetical protein
MSEPAQVECSVRIAIKAFCTETSHLINGVLLTPTRISQDTTAAQT